MEIRNTVLSQQSDEIESSDGELALGWWEECAIVRIECLELGKVAIEGGYVVRADTPECADFEDISGNDEIIRVLLALWEE
jgi:hypothetical protein